jgi:tricarballylate dehydrogenase
VFPRRCLCRLDIAVGDGLGDAAVLLGRLDRAARGFVGARAQPAYRRLNLLKKTLYVAIASGPANRSMEDRVQAGVLRSIIDGLLHGHHAVLELLEEFGASACGHDPRGHCLQHFPYLVKLDNAFKRHRRHYSGLTATDDQAIELEQLQRLPNRSPAHLELLGYLGLPKPLVLRQRPRVDGLSEDLGHGGRGRPASELPATGGDPKLPALPRTAGLSFSIPFVYCWHTVKRINGFPPFVVVVGGGNAALCAALAASESGARVLVLERSAPGWRGGNSKYTRNLRCAHGADSVMDGSYDEEEFLKDLVSVSGEDLDLGLARETIAASRDLPHWMETKGVRWQAAHAGSLQLGRTNRFFLGGGKALLNAYYRAAAREGIEVRYGARVTELDLDGRRCHGVNVETEAGNELIEADAVVVASGGFEANEDWLRRLWGEAADNYVIRGSRQNDGLLLRHLLDNGALPAGDEKRMHAIAVDARSPRYEGGLVTRVDSVPFSVVVNAYGKRFYDEGEDLWPKRYATWGQLIAEQPSQIAYSIFDAQVAGRFIPSIYPPIESDDIDGLASELGLPAQELGESIRRYNASVPDDGPAYDPKRLDGRHTEGLDPPKSNWALRIERPPLMAYPLRPGVTFTYLGVKVTPRAEVLSEDGPFERLYAAGEIMAGNILRRGYLAGFGMTIGTVFGRRAGREAGALSS